MEEEKKKVSFSFSSIKKKKKIPIYLSFQTFLILKRDPINVDCVWPQRSARENE